MLLSPASAELFFRLHYALMHFVNQRLGIFPNAANLTDFVNLPPEARYEVRKAWLQNVSLIETFVDENPEQFSKDELDGILNSYEISLASSVTRMLEDRYREAKERHGVVTSLLNDGILSEEAKSTKPKKPKKSSKKRARSTVDSASEPIYRFKITLRGTHPPIWRRILVRDGTLDELHMHIQRAMGWTNSHLYQFRIRGQHYSNAAWFEDAIFPLDGGDSMTTRMSDLIPRHGRKFRFDYEYDFGDCWDHEVLFEGFAPFSRRKEYPLCVAGRRTCPPEDVGGVWGFAEFLEAITDPSHECYDELLEWCGPFDPDGFSPSDATAVMRAGLPTWP